MFVSCLVCCKIVLGFDRCEDKAVREVTEFFFTVTLNGLSNTRFAETLPSFSSFVEDALLKNV